MTTTQEQREAQAVAQAQEAFPKYRWIGTLSTKEKRLRLFLFCWLRGFGPGWGAPDHYNAALSIGIEWKLADLWLGVFWKGGRDEWWVWVCLLPCLPIRFHYRRSYGGWIMSPSPEPKCDPKHARRWWQLVRVLP